MKLVLLSFLFLFSFAQLSDRGILVEPQSINICDTICKFGTLDGAEKCYFITTELINSFEEQWDACHRYSGAQGKAEPHFLDDLERLGFIVPSWKQPPRDNAKVYMPVKKDLSQWCKYSSPSAPCLPFNCANDKREVCTKTCSSDTTSCCLFVQEPTAVTAKGKTSQSYEVIYGGDSCAITALATCAFDAAICSQCSEEQRKATIMFNVTCSCATGYTNNKYGTGGCTPLTKTNPVQKTTTFEGLVVPPRTTTTVVDSETTVKTPEFGVECDTPCENNSTCTRRLLHKNDRCRCSVGYTGTYCESAVPKGNKTEELLEINDQLALINTVSDMVPYVTAQMTTEQRIELEIPPQEFISECSLAGHQCAQYRQNAFMNMGSCYTINFDESKSELIWRSGADLDNEGRFLPTGYSVSVALRFVAIHKAKPPHGKCVSKDNLKNIQYFYNETYTIEGCLKSCYQQMVIDKCGCGDPAIPLPSSIKLTHCTLAKRDCVGSVNGDTSKCYCPQPCTTSAYEATYSLMRWPAKTYRIPLCHNVSKGNADKMQQCNQHYRDTHSKVQIYFKQLAYLLTEEGPGYMFEHLWSDLGSNLGLFMGFSYICFAELFIFLYDMCRAAFGKKMIMQWKRITTKNKQGNSEP